MSKPTKRQEFIIQLLNIIEGEGLEYAVLHYGIETVLEEINDDKLIKLVEKYYKAAKKLEAAVEKLKEEIAPFMEDDSEF